MTNHTTNDLEDHIELLRKLDKTRKESAQLRNDGFDCIQKILTKNSLNEKDLWKSISNDNELEEIVKKFQSELASKDNECTELIVNSTNAPNKLIIAGLNDEGELKSLSLKKPSSELAMELKKNPGKNSKIQDLFTSKAGYNQNDCDLTLLRALYRKPEAVSDDKKDNLEAFINKCEALSIEDISSHEISVWYAANLLQTLVAIPGGAHLRATFYCYYWIIRELYTADSAEWSIGGARAGQGGQVTAYMTSECVNALLALAEAHKETSKYITAIVYYLEREKQLSNLENLYKPDKPDKISHIKDWIDREKDRLARSCYISLNKYSKHLTVSLDELPPEISLLDEGPKGFKQHCIKCKNTLENRIIDSKNHILFVLEEINSYRNNHDEETKVTEDLNAFNKNLQHLKKENIEETYKEIKKYLKEKNKDKVIRSHQGHYIATNAIVGALERSIKALKYFKGNGKKGDLNKESDEILNSINNNIHRILIPTQNYLSTVLDRELAINTKLQYGQPEELAWATLSYGKLTENWDKDNRLALATRILIKNISNHGLFPNRRHFHFDPKKGTKQTEASFAINAFAQLLSHVQSVDIDDGLAKKLLRLLEDTRIIKSSKKLDGWRQETSPIHWEPDPDATAHAVLALDEINRMLDERINHMILKHFSIKQPDLDLPKTSLLDDLFYSDYGLASIKEEITIKRTESIAVTLQRMQAHVRKISLPKTDKETCNSMVLYGPAGTGKTFLVESLAKTCDVPMIEITPSDIVKAGVDNVERRARTVFEALSLLTRVVILFDEFDPVLKRRDPDNQNPSVFSFLTPGMLPKLKTLHDNAKTRSVAYILITNLIGSLDEAAIREGRFDEKIGIFPPDLLSRTGRFLDQIYKFHVEIVSEFEMHKLNIVNGLKQIINGFPSIPYIGREKHKDDIIKELGQIKNIRGPDSSLNTQIVKLIDEFKTINIMWGPSSKQKTQMYNFINIIDPINISQKPDDKLKEYIVNSIKKSEGKGMTSLGKPGWFTCPETYAKIKQNTIFEYFAYFDERKAELKNWPASEDELKGLKGESNIAKKEYREWAWIICWDQQFKIKPKKWNKDPLNLLFNTLKSIPTEPALPSKIHSLFYMKIARYLKTLR